MEAYYAVLQVLRTFALLVGVLIVFSGLSLAVFEARGEGGGVRAARRISSYASLGLEFFVGATILNLVLNPTWTAVATTLLTILVRKLITASFNISGGGT